MPDGYGMSHKTEASDTAPKLVADRASHANVLLETYREAVAESHGTGRPISFRVQVSPGGGMAVTQVEEAVTPGWEAEKTGAQEADLERAVAAALERGRLQAARILDDEDMLSAAEFAKRLGITRQAVNDKRRKGQLLGLEGARRGFRYPVWQLDAEGRPRAELALLHEQLGGPWAVYRFLVQPHGELGGLTGREALERGNLKAARDAAESIGRDFR